MAENDLYELVLEGTLYNNQIVNTFGFVQTSVTGGFLGQALIDEWQAMVLPSYIACLAGPAVINTIRVRDVHPGTAAAAEETLTTGNVGTNGSTPAPNQIAALISWYTNRSGRSYRGRTYLPAVNQLHLGSGGVIGSTSPSLYGAFRTALISTFGPSSSGSFRAVVISRFTGKAERPVPVGTLIQSGLVRTVVATQRKRRLGVGA